MSCVGDAGDLTRAEGERSRWWEVVDVWAGKGITGQLFWSQGRFSLTALWSRDGKRARLVNKDTSSKVSLEAEMPHFTRRVPLYSACSPDSLLRELNSALDDKTGKLKSEHGYIHPSIFALSSIKPLDINAPCRIEGISRQWIRMLR